jgi:hypothetical protein
MARRKKNEDEPLENNDNINNEADDTFGLPEVEYEPLKREENVTENPVVPEQTPVEEPVNEVKEEEPVVEETPVVQEEVHHHYHHEETEHDHHHDEIHDYSYSEPEKPVWPKVLAIVLLILLAGGAAYYFGYYQPAAKKEALEREQRERALEQEAAKKREAERLAEEARRAADQKRLDSLANVTKEGTLEVLQERTGQYYVVVASAIDDDLLTDYANKLVRSGKTVKIIPPFGKTGKFYRLAVDSKDSYADAQATADGMKGGEFGDQLWVVRY